MPTDPRYDYALRSPRPPEQLDDALAGADIPLEVRLEMYRKLHELRQFGKRAHDLFLQNLVKGTSHLSLGMEAIATGFAAAMKPDDYTFATYRGHGHSLARGMSIGPALAELLGRENGILGGKGGSMHLTDVDHGMMGSYAIVGAHMCVANGAGWSAQLRDSGQVAVCFFGDGTTNIGAFHEALNLAKIWNLPVVFVCENNLYMEYTPIDLITAVPRPAADRASAYGLAPLVIDGNDPDAVFLAARDAIGRARAGDGPSLIEAVTYRTGGHSRADPAKYRPPNEVAAWMERDPIPVYRARLSSLEISDEQLNTIENEVSTSIDDATEFAKSGREPGEDALLTEVYADGGSRWRNGTPEHPVDVGHSTTVVNPQPGTATTPLTYREAVARGIAQEMRRDPRLVMLGEDIAAAGGVFKTTVGLLDEFGPDRVRDTPISEQAIIGAAMGAAMTGTPVIAEIMFSDFLAVCWDMVANEIAKSRYMTDGQVSFPLVIRTANGGGARFGAQHSQSVENWAMAIPGLKVGAPSTPQDVVGLMAAAIRDPDPVVFFEHKSLMAAKAEVPDGEIVDHLGSARVMREGTDATIVALALMVPRAIAAAEQLAGDGISVEVIDVRSLVPLDTETILASVAKTGRLFTVEENPRLCGWGAEIVSIVDEEAFWSLDGPSIRITTPHIPLPSAAALEDLAMPSTERIYTTVAKSLEGGGG
jgi:pyruvate/2-oxoglutarate/acetoin dehydrogenase E1 component/TPP-dependent pyruvate/acetoin dehydrogenase alpha subunit